MEEIWKDIPGYEGIYQVSNFGQVRSCERIRQNGRKFKAHLKALCRQYKGYLRVQLTRNGKSRSWFVHRLVLETFMGPMPSGKVVNHKNGVRHDNHLSNLEYVTPHENSLHAYRHLGRVNNLVGEKHWAAKLVTDEVRAIRLLYSTGKYTHKKLAEIFGVKAITIGGIIRRTKWVHIQ